MIHWILTFVLISFIPLCWSVGIYQQCGGEGYQGSTNCDWPLGCFRRSRWFSSCQVSCPGADWECVNNLGGYSNDAGLAKAWEQCGGEGWNGPRGCAQYPCQWRSKWYAQCRPDCPAGWLCQGSGTLSTGSSIQPSVSSTLPSTLTSTEPDSSVSFGSSSPYIPLSTENSDEESLNWQIDSITDEMLGRRIVAHMLGSRIFDGILPGIDLSEKDDFYDLLVGHIVELVESEEAGSLGTFGFAMQSEDLDERIEAWTAMYERVEMISDSSELVTALLLDPLFLNLIQTTNFLEDLQIDTRAMRSNSKGCDGPVPDLGYVGGKYGDDNEGVTGRLWDTGKWMFTGTYEKRLYEIDVKGVKPEDLDSRLGAYYVTRNYGPGTVGNAVHNAIGEVYRRLGPVGEEKIGRVFNDKRAIALYEKSVHSSANLCMAQIEHRYWTNVYDEDRMSIGGQLGAMFQPGIRDCIQKYLPNIRNCFQLSIDEIDQCLQKTAALVFCSRTSSRAVSLDTTASQLRRLLDSQRTLAVPSGYMKTNYICMKKTVYCNSKATNALACIVEDRTSHKGGVWKAGPEKAWAEKGCPANLRSGTYDASLNWIAP